MNNTMVYITENDGMALNDTVKVTLEAIQKVRKEYDTYVRHKITVGFLGQQEEETQFQKNELMLKIADLEEKVQDLLCDKISDEDINKLLENKYDTANLDKDLDQMLVQ